MLLTIDIGNTQTVLGIFAGEELVHHWRISTQKERTADELRLWLLGIFGLERIDLGDIHGSAIASVVPAATAALRRISEESISGPTVLVEPGVKTGIPVDTDNPREVGADRLVNAVAALERYGAPAVVVDFGTSTNFDVVSQEGAYIGGAIGTGLEVSLNALITAASALRRVELLPPRAAVGRNTVEAVRSGLLYGHAGLVDGIMDRIVAEVGGDPTLIATGGLAPTIVPHCRSELIIDEFLTLDGLRMIFERNSDG